MTLLLNSHSKCSCVKNECQMLIYYFYVFEALLVSSVGFEESNRSRGGAKLAPGPSVKAHGLRRDLNDIKRTPR